MKRNLALPIFAFSAALLLAACGPKGTKVSSSGSKTSEPTSIPSTPSSTSEESTAEEPDVSVTSTEESTTVEESSGTVYYTIRFDSNGGSPVEDLIVEEGQVATKPTDPTKDDAEFVAWYTAAEWTEEFLFDWTQPIENDWNLIALWSDTQVTPPDPVAGAWKILGTVNGAEDNWDYSKGVEGKETVGDPANFAEFSLDLKKGDNIKFTDGVNWLGYGAFGADYSKFFLLGSEAIVDEDTSNDDNIIVKFDGTYNFYLKEDDGASKIYVTAENVDMGDEPTGWFIWGKGEAFPDKDEDGVSDFDPDDGYELKADAENIGHITMTFAVGDVFKITDGSSWYGAKALGMKYGGLVADTGDDPNIKVAYAGEYTLYFNNEHKIYATQPEGAPEPEVPEVTTPTYPEGSEAVGWYIVGTGVIFSEDWTVAGGVQLHNNPAGPTDKGCVFNLTLSDGDIFKFTNGSDVWSSAYDTNTESFTAVSDGYGGTNIKCVVTGVYDIYVNASNTLWIQNH